MTSKTQSQHTNLTATDKAWSIDAATRAEVLGRVAEAKKASGQTRYLQAVAVHAVVTVDGFGQDRLYADQKALAVALGCAPSNVTALKYLGRVIADTGITPDHADWGTLSDKAGNLGTYVKALKSGKKVTLTGAKKAAKVEKATTPKKVTPASERQKSNGTREESPALQALETIRSEVASLSRADAVIVANALAGILSDVQAHLKSLPREEKATTSEKATA